MKVTNVHGAENIEALMIPAVTLAPLMIPKMEMLSTKQESFQPFIPVLHGIMAEDNMKPLQDFITSTVIDLWDNNDLTDFL